MRLASPARPRAHPRAADCRVSLLFSLAETHTGAGWQLSSSFCCLLLPPALTAAACPFPPLFALLPLRKRTNDGGGGVAGGGLCLLCRVDLEVGKVDRWVGSLLILIQSLLKSIGAFPRVRLLARRLESLSQSLQLQPHLLRFPAGLRSLPSTPLPVLVGCAPFTKPALG